MLNQVTRALAALISPIASRRTGKTENTSADRDAMGQAYENLHQKKNSEGEPETKKEESSAAAQEQPSAQVIPIHAPSEGKSPEEILEARKREIGNSQVWMGLVTDLEEQRSGQGEQTTKATGPDAYEKANAGSSKTARTKKGVILDKKAA